MAPNTMDGNHRRPTVVTTSEFMKTTTKLSLAGIVGVAASLGFGELVSGLISSVSSPITAIGERLIDWSPPALKDFAVTTFGTADKPALLIGTVIVALLLGAAVGVWSYRRTWLALLVFFGFAIIGIVAGIQSPLVDPAWTTVLGLLGGAVGYNSLTYLQRLIASESPAVPVSAGLSTPDTESDLRIPEAPVGASRREFLTAAGGIGAVAVASGTLGRFAFGGGVSIDPSTLAVPDAAGTLAAPSQANMLSVPGITPIIVPNDQFYLIDTALAVPRVDPASWSLRVNGMVDTELELSLDELKAFDLIEEYVTIACVSNPVGGPYVGNAKWTGVRLAEVLDLAGVQNGATQTVGTSVDGWTAGFPTEAVFDGREPLIALAMNDEPLPAKHGFPARLIVPGLYGYVSATKWLSEITLTTWEGFDGYWVPRGWAKEGPIKTQSRIDVPTKDDPVSAGTTTVAGVAWAPLKGIDKVEVRVNGGEWFDAILSEPLSEKSWVQWRADVPVTPGQALIEVRATDGEGYTQEEDRVEPRPDGAEGFDAVVVQVTA